MNPEKELHTHDNGRQKCSCCGRTIPANVERISFKYRSNYGYSYKRVCAMCICRLADKIDEKSLEKWRMKVLQDEL